MGHTATQGELTETCDSRRSRGGLRLQVALQMLYAG